MWDNMSIWPLFTPFEVEVKLRLRSGEVEVKLNLHRRKLKLNFLPSAAFEHTLPPPFRGTAEFRHSKRKGNNEV